MIPRTVSMMNAVWHNRKNQQIDQMKLRYIHVDLVCVVDFGFYLWIIVLLMLVSRRFYESHVNGTQSYIAESYFDYAHLPIMSVWTKGHVYQLPYMRFCQFTPFDSFRFIERVVQARWNTAPQWACCWIIIEIYCYNWESLADDV